ncbi:MAG: TldD/PmbA family protein [Chloroflexi bacterium]|nr:TldD/PmbA family protein [Chloroflexota bacterium]
MKDITARALNVAQVRGAAYADIRVVARDTQRVAVKNGKVEAIQQDETQGFGVRVIVNGAWGFAASSRLEMREVETVVAQAIAIAKASAHVKARDAHLGEPVVNKESYETPVKINPFTVPMNDKIDLLLRADEAMRRVSGVKVARAEMAFVRENKLFASTEGSLINQEIVESGCGIVALATDLQTGEVQVRSYPNSVGRHQQTRGYEFILEQKLAENAPRVAEEAVALLTAEQCPSYDAATIILDSSQLALQIHESCGHPIELDRVLGSEAAYAGTSFLTPEKLGRFRYGSEVVNIVADATVPGGLGTFGFDDEGVPAQKTEIIRNGIFVGYLTSRESAHQLGLGKSNGTMRADGWARPPIIRMTNINLLPGTWDVDALIADTDDGIWMETNRSWSIDDKRLNFQFGTELGWEIKGGKKTRLLKNATYTGITPQFWQACDAVCNEKAWIVWGTPNCGKGQPSQVAHTGHGAAPARFRGVRVGVIR